MVQVKAAAHLLLQVSLTPVTSQLFWLKPNLKCSRVIDNFKSGGIVSGYCHCSQICSIFQVVPIFFKDIKFSKEIGFPQSVLKMLLLSHGFSWIRGDNSVQSHL